MHNKYRTDTIKIDFKPVIELIPTWRESSKISNLLIKIIELELFIQIYLQNQKEGT